MNQLGVVEDISDPLELGRCRVRLMGKHNDDLNELPLASLPWFSSLSSVFPLSVGDWVLLAQVSPENYIIQGKINAISNTNHEDLLGFYDPNDSSPRNIEPDLQKASRSDYPMSPSYLSKEVTVVKGVLVAKAAGGSSGDTWDSPLPEETNYPIYPNVSQMFNSKAGHQLEFDDTPGYERICLFHSSGTYQEMQSSGDQVTVIRGEDYEIVVQDKKVWIGGSCSVTIAGDSNMLVQGSHTLEVEGDYNINVKGNLNTHVNGDSNNEVVGDSAHLNNGKFKVLASRIDLN